MEKYIPRNSVRRNFDVCGICENFSVSPCIRLGAPTCAFAKLYHPIHTQLFHLKNSYEKLRIHSKTKAVAKALREKIVQSILFKIHPLHKISKTRLQAQVVPFRFDF